MKVAASRIGDVIRAVFPGGRNGGPVERRRLSGPEQEEAAAIARPRGLSLALALLESAQGVAGASGPEKIVEQAVEGAIAALGVRFCGVATQEEGGSWRLTHASTTGGPAGAGAVAPAALDASKGGLVRRALREGVAVAGDAAGGEAMPVWLAGMGARWVAAVTMTSRDEVQGLALMAGADEGSGPGPGELTAVRAYWGIVAGALLSARAHQAEVARVGELERELESRRGATSARRSRQEFTVGDLRVDGAQERAYVGNRQVSLSPTEFAVLYVLAEQSGQPVSGEVLRGRVWGQEHASQGNVVDVTIHRLRRKLARERPAARLVTVRGRGYTLTS